jgi:hypothetical protein
MPRLRGRVERRRDLAQHLVQALEVLRLLFPQILAEQPIELRDLRVKRNAHQKHRGCVQLHLISRISFSLVFAAASILPM